ncbi:glycosyl transferase [Actinomadura rubrobrunea]|uniref:Glycosyl transferase n=1 Tax=Actinomadura rubrobrunea TaxID=115335 RepID=A0A9W6PNZ2_9ACTN|nr:glycosyltransferase [Actinomadura rubrobrunea]GLW61994.1 glycosyl transferase [Actinomadura rubrobrunea]
MTGRAEPIRVLHVSQPTHGGVAGYIAQATQDQLQRGWEVAVACPAEGSLAGRLHAQGVPHIAWAAGRSPGPGTLAECRRLHRIIRRYRPHIVHLHSSKAGLAGRLRPRPDIPVMFQPHGWSWLATRGAQRTAGIAWERFAARRAHAVICVGQGELHQGQTAGVDALYTVVRNGVDLQRFTRTDASERLAARKLLDVPSDAPLAVCLGRVTRQKGQDVLIAAWPRVRARCPDARLVLVGDGDMLPRLRGYATDGIRFVPAVEDPRPWLAASDVVVMPSRWEGLPLVALEALAMGRPLVGTAIPGLIEVVTPRVGALVPAEDPSALAAEVARRLLVRELAEAEGQAAARRALEFDATRTFARLAAITYGLATAAYPVATARRTARLSERAPGADPAIAAAGPAPGMDADPGP